MEEYRRSQERGKEALQRELASRGVRTSKLATIGVFGEPSYLGVSSTRAGPAEYDDKWQLMAAGKVFCHSTTRGKGRQILSQPPPAGRRLGDSYSPRKCFSEYVHASEGGAAVDRLRQSALLDSTQNIAKRLSSSSQAQYRPVPPFRLGYTSPSVDDSATPNFLLSPRRVPR
jgi:hypothetical protein